MNAEQIDEVFQAMAEWNLDKLNELAGTSITQEEIERDRAAYELLMKSLMAKIEQGDYDYFFSKGSKGNLEYKGIFIELMEHFTDADKIKTLIDSHEKLELNHVDIRGLVIATNDSDYIVEIIVDEEKRKKYGLDNFDIRRLIEAVKDPNGIKKIIEYDVKYAKIGLENYDITSLIKATNDPLYMIGIIEDEEKHKKLGLNNDNITSLIKATNDPLYMIGIIEDEEKHKKLGLNNNNITSLIKATEEPDYINKIIKDKEKIVKWKLSNLNIISLLNAKNIDDYLKFLEEGNNYTEKSTQTVDLPFDMTIGVEIESEGKNSIFIQYFMKAIHEKWKGTFDQTLKNGVEVVSPILTGDTSITTEQIRNVCGRLNRLRPNCI